MVLGARVQCLCVSAIPNFSTTEGGAQPKIPAMSCEHSRLARPSNELRRWGQNKLQATLGPRLNGFPTSPTGPTRTPSRHVGAHLAPARSYPFNMAAAIEQMGREIGRNLMPLAVNQQRTEESLDSKEEGTQKKDWDDYGLAKLKG